MVCCGIIFAGTVRLMSCSEGHADFQLDRAKKSKVYWLHINFENDSCLILTKSRNKRKEANQVTKNDLF